MKTVLTTIKPTSGMAVSFKPRSKEGMEEKAELFAAYELPAEIANLHDGMLRNFALNAFSAYVLDCLKSAAKESKQEFTYSLEEAFKPTQREFLITRKDLEAWTIGFAIPLVSAAIASKSGLSIDSVKVTKKAIAYRDLLLSLASRSIMLQEDIDTCIKVMELIASSGKQNAYTDNVAQAIERKQSKLNDYLAGKQGNDEDDIDF